MTREPVIAVIGAAAADDRVLALARAVGEEIASRGATLVCGGLGGVMAEAARGARERGGHTIGILPSYDGRTANPWIEFAVASGLGEARNAVVVGTADAVIALAGEGGTLAEIGFALKLRRPIVALGAWSEIRGVEQAASPGDALNRLFARIG